MLHRRKPPDVLIWDVLGFEVCASPSFEVAAELLLVSRQTAASTAFKRSLEFPTCLLVTAEDPSVIEFAEMTKQVCPVT
jgi:hypothetical protein